MGRFMQQRGMGFENSVQELARVGGVHATGSTTLPWVVTDAAEQPIAVIGEFLRDFVACGNSAASCRSYAFDLLRWFRFLAAVDVEWQRAQRGEVRDFVLWLRVGHNPARDRHRPDPPAPGAVNPRTGKTSLRAGYAPATINHAVSVLSAFYDFHLLSGQGPVVSPVPPQSRDGRRLRAHHNPARAVPVAPARRLPAETTRGDAAGGARRGRGGPVRGAGLQPGPRPVRDVLVQRRAGWGAAGHDGRRCPSR